MHVPALHPQTPRANAGRRPEMNGGAWGQNLGQLLSGLDLSLQAVLVSASAHSGEDRWRQCQNTAYTTESLPSLPPSFLRARGSRGIGLVLGSPTQATGHTPTGPDPAHKNLCGQTALAKGHGGALPLLPILISHPHGCCWGPTNPGLPPWPVHSHHSLAMGLALAPLSLVGGLAESALGTKGVGQTAAGRSLGGVHTCPQHRDVLLPTQSLADGLGHLPLPGCLKETAKLRTGSSPLRELSGGRVPRTLPPLPSPNAALGGHPAAPQGLYPGPRFLPAVSKEPHRITGSQSCLPNRSTWGRLRPDPRPTLLLSQQPGCSSLAPSRMEGPNLPSCPRGRPTLP